MVCIIERISDFKKNLAEQVETMLSVNAPTEELREALGGMDNKISTFF